MGKYISHVFLLHFMLQVLLLCNSLLFAAGKFSEKIIASDEAF